LTEKQFLLAYDRKRTSTLTLDSEPGAHTGNSRQYIPGYSDSNIVYLDTVSGNDANDGSTELLAKLTYASAATAAGSTKTIRVINDGAALSTNITKPTEMKRGVSGTISSSTSAPVDAWTQAGTPSFSTTLIEAVAWSPRLNLFAAVGQSGKVATSPDGDTWTQHSAIFSAAQALDIVWSDASKVFYCVGNNGAFAYSSDGSTWTEQVISEIEVSGGSFNINCVIANSDASLIVVASNVGTIASSADGGETWQKANTTLSGDSFLGGCWSDRLGKFYLSTFSGNVYSSADGSNWSAAATPSFSGDPIYWITDSEQAGRLVAVGGSFSTPKLAYSTDGDAFTQSATPAMSGARANYVEYCVELEKYVAAGNGGQLAYSSDGNTWTLAATPSFGSTAITDIAYSPLLGKLSAVGGSGKIAYSTAFANTISANVAGFTIQAVQYSGTITAYNCTMKQPGTTANLSLNACRVTEAGSHISSNTAGSFATLFEGDRHTTCTPAAQNDIDCNLDTVGGTWYIYNASATGFERVRDCLVTDGMIANFNVTVGGRANIQGDSENILIDAEVTTDDPKFVDTTDYKLQFQTNGYARNSLAAGRSAIYFNSAGSPRDIGAWSYVESAVSYFFAKSAVLYKGEITHEIEETVSEQQGDSGVVSVYGNANRIKEIITISYGDTREVDRAPFEYIRLLKDKGVKLILDAEWESNAGTVTVNGNQAAGVEFLTVDSCIYYNGLWVTVSGKRYWIMRASPSNTAATKLILDRPLEDAVSDNDVLTTNYPPGVGEYQFAGLARLQLKRKAPDGLKGWQTGLQLRFVRKYQ